MLIRSDGLADTMSRYLIRRIEDNPRIVVRTHTQVVALEGNGRLERIRWRDYRTGDAETHDIGHMFIMIGAVPNTGWLDGCVVLDEKGFVKTGPDLSREELDAAHWPLPRPPLLARDQSTRGLRRRRRTRRQHQACGLGGWRRLDCNRIRTSSTAKGLMTFDHTCAHIRAVNDHATASAGVKTASRYAVGGCICGHARSVDRHCGLPNLQMRIVVLDEY